MNKFIYSLIVLFSITLNAQKNSDSLKVNINAYFGGKPIEYNTNYVSKHKDTLSFSTIKFYLSSFRFHFSDNSVYKMKNSYHLIDLTNKTQNISFPKLNLDNKALKKIQFNIGVDSLMSVSGAMKNDLDPINGMYWAWQSGYINFKIEGTSSSCMTRNNKFQFHVGGYLKPNYAMRTIVLNIKENNVNEINLGLDIENLFQTISLKEMNTIMIPGNEAMIFADLFSKAFFIQ